jgi:orotidine-5'-phosphate decarboxylase
MATAKASSNKDVGKSQFRIPEYKSAFIKFLLETGALRVGGDYLLKSRRQSPYFINIGDFNDGKGIVAIGEAYARSIIGSGVKFDILYGIPEKGVSLAIATSAGLLAEGRNVPWFFTRKTEKKYGEATGLAKSEKSKAMIVGRAPASGERIMMLDDVMTTGGSKYDAIESLASFLDKPKFTGVAIAVDRQEVGIDGKSAIDELSSRTGIPVMPIVTATDIRDYLIANGRMEEVRRIDAYLMAYGTESARKRIMHRRSALPPGRSLVIACDGLDSLDDFAELVRDTSNLDGVGGYKIGFELGLSYGLPAVVAAARKHTRKELIYDHQKAGTDIPDTGKGFAAACKSAGIGTIILLPQAGPETERAWIYRAYESGLNVIVGGIMTHQAYLLEEGGYISEEKALEVYRIAARAGVNDFVAPATKPEFAERIRKIVLAEGSKEPAFFVPGFGAQGKSAADAAKVFGSNVHAIIGRAIIQADDRKEAVREQLKLLMNSA